MLKTLAEKTIIATLTCLTTFNMIPTNHLEDEFYHDINYKQEIHNVGGKNIFERRLLFQWAWTPHHDFNIMRNWSDFHQQYRYLTFNHGASITLQINKAGKQFTSKKSLDWIRIRTYDLSKTRQTFAKIHEPHTNQTINLRLWEEKTSYWIGVEGTILQRDSFKSTITSIITINIETVNFHRELPPKQG